MSVFLFNLNPYPLFLEQIFVIAFDFILIILPDTLFPIDVFDNAPPTLSNPFPKASDKVPLIAVLAPTFNAELKRLSLFSSFSPEIYFPLSLAIDCAAALA